MAFLSQAACAISQTASFADPLDTSSALVCRVCQGNRIPRTTQRPTNDEDVCQLYGLMEGVVARHIPSRGPLAVRALLFLRRMVLHAPTDDVLCYERSVLCRWCSAQLYSPDKAVRAEAT